MAAKRFLKYFNTDSPIIWQVLAMQATIGRAAMKVWYKADISALAWLPKNREFFRSTVNGRILRSAILLSISYRPSFLYVNSCFQNLFRYRKAFCIMSPKWAFSSKRSSLSLVLIAIIMSVVLLSLRRRFISSGGRSCNLYSSSNPYSWPIHSRKLRARSSPPCS